MKRIICKGGGEPVIKDLILNGNGQQRTAIVIGDYTPEEKSWPNWQTFQTWIKEMDRACHVVTPETTPEEARTWVASSSVLSIEGGWPDRYQQGVRNMGLVEPIRDGFLNGGLEEIGGLSAGAMLVCERVRYLDDGDPTPGLNIRAGREPEHKTAAYKLQEVDGLGLIPRTVMAVHFDNIKGWFFRRKGFFEGTYAFVCLGDDGIMEVDFDKVEGVYRPVDVRFTGYHKIAFGGKEIDRKRYLELLTTPQTR